MMLGTSHAGASLKWRLCKDVMKIIIADDCQNHLVSLKNLLEENYFITITSDNGNDAWEKISVHDDTGLFILDYHMPGFNALEICSKIRCHDQHRSKPILIYTSENSLNLRAKSKELGAMWLVKPINSNALISVIKKMQIKFCDPSLEHQK